MKEVLGKFTTPSPGRRPVVSIEFSKNNFLPRWQHISMMSLMVKSLIASRISEVDADNLDFIANELLENCYKFNAIGTVKFDVYYENGKFTLLFSNQIDEKQMHKLRGFVKTILQSDNPQELLLSRIEANLENDTSSSLGLLTLMNDYKVTLGWEIEPVRNHFYTLLTSAHF
ncbi:MAG: hypothetical protein KDI30_00085 [Pseudomonadales bacterium]|nr:hypothetical protein [Pseudomonadales bacterium]